MKINYVAHLDPFAHKGGGEVVLRQLIAAGKARGHEFGFRTCSPVQNTLLDEQDLSLFADLFNCPGNRPFLQRKELEDLIEKGPYVHFDNAYVDICDLGYLPCNGEVQSTCPHKGLKAWKHHVKKQTISRNCFSMSPLVRRIYHESKVNYFVSPLHRRVVSRALGLEEEKGRVLRPLVDTQKFTNRQEERDIENLFVGVLSEAKGLENMRKMFSQKPITLIGKSVDGKEPGFGDWLGPVSYNQVPDYMNRAKNFVFMPRWPEPQGRVVVEAALCGCNLVVNENVGANSFEFDLHQPENLSGAEEEFWNELEQLQ